MLASHSLPPTSRLRSSSRHGPARAVTSASLIFAAADKADVVLSFDIGTTATKACAVDQNGRILSSATAPYARGTTSAGSTSEQFPGDWLEAARSSCRDTLAVLPVRDALDRAAEGRASSGTPTPAAADFSPASHGERSSLIFPGSPRRRARLHRADAGASDAHPSPPPPAVAR